MYAVLRGGCYRLRNRCYTANGKRSIRPDTLTLDLVRKTEGEGLTSKQAGVISSALNYHFQATEKLRRDNDRLQGEIDKMRLELKYAVDNVKQRLELNLEQGVFKDKLSKGILEAIDSKIDKEFQRVKTQMESGKVKSIKIGIGAVVSCSAVAFGISRLFS